MHREKNKMACKPIFTQNISLHHSLNVAVFLKQGENMPCVTQFSIPTLFIGSFSQKKKNAVIPFFYINTILPAVLANKMQYIHLYELS